MGKGQQRIGIMGGTFDPVHEGHLAIARAAYERCELDKVLFMPTGNPHFKLDQKVTSAAMRVQMVALAIEDCPQFELDCREVKRQGVTYTVDTLRELRDERPQDELFFILGADAAKTLPHWRRAEELSQLCTFAVVERAGYDAQRVSEALAQASCSFSFTFVPMALIDVSSTGLRERVAQGQPVTGMLPSSVEAYIARNGLYKKG